jgi:hypothetical protein
MRRRLLASRVTSTPPWHVVAARVCQHTRDARVDCVVYLYMCIHYFTIPRELLREYLGSSFTAYFHAENTRTRSPYGVDFRKHAEMNGCPRFPLVDLGVNADIQARPRNATHKLRGPARGPLSLRALEMGHDYQRQVYQLNQLPENQVSCLVRVPRVVARRPSPDINHPAACFSKCAHLSRSRTTTDGIS